MESVLVILLPRHESLNVDLISNFSCHKEMESKLELNERSNQIKIKLTDQNKSEKVSGLIWILVTRVTNCKRIFGEILERVEF